jgi:bis(5'-nucleosidyl)-tetraphosphatase
MEQSFGVIPVTLTNEEPQVFIIQNYSNAWLLPKGHVQGVETPQETAKRELFEETGLRVTKWLSLGLFKEEYSYTRVNRLIHKQVEYFPALVEGEIVIQEEEIRTGRWVRLKELEREVSFPELQYIAREFVERYTVSQPN